jgi:predicted DNA-binding transcriptional regulator AlpA
MNENPSVVAPPPAAELLDKVALAKLLGIAKSSIGNLVARGDLPKPVRLTHKIVRWRRSTILAWLDSLEKETGHDVA